MVEKDKPETKTEKPVIVKVPKDMRTAFLVAGGILGIGAVAILTYTVGKQEGYNQFKESFVAFMEGIEANQVFAKVSEPANEALMKH